MNDYSKITALYSRLSVGDEDRDGGESNSIQNQKKFLESHARQLKLTNIRHYIDDDESGRFFDRSAYSRMIEDVENGKIGVCIMKDMTRWGRDYLQVGNAMEIFRRNNVRFIAVNNGIDSEKPDTLEFAPFINIMSEWYARDISKKVKTGIRTKGTSGKGGVVHTEILLPDHAPAEYADRAVLWNEVEKIEKAKNAQLAREIEISLPRELTREQSISLVREYVKRHFVAAGMCADVCLHDTGGGNPHAHIMLTMRPFDEDGTWGAKQKKEYILDRDGNKIYDPKKRQYKCKSIPATDWNEQTKAEEWRAAWAGLCNQTLEQYGHAERIDHRSYERQGTDQIPTVHLGVAASAMEKRGIRTERGDLNREIEVTNQKLRQLKARISKLQDWLKEEAENTDPPTLADYIQGILSRKAQAGKTGYSQSLYNLKDAAKMLNFLQANSIMDMAGLDEKFKSMIGEQLDIQGKLKPVERRLATLKKHLEQADIYFKCKGKKPLTEAEQILFTTAKDYLKGVMNGKTTIPTKTWKEEYTKLTAERKKLNQRYLALKEEVKEAEKIRKSVYSILRQEQREQQPHRKQDIER